MMIQCDELLVARIRQHDSDALASFIELHRTALIGFIRSITGVRMLAVIELDDLFQDVATTALQSLSSAPLDQYEPMQWLQQIARRRVVDAHRFHFGAQRRDAGRHQSMHAPISGSPESRGLEDVLAASLTSASAVMSRNVRINRLLAAIESLPTDQAAAIRLRYVDGLATKQIAERLGKTDVAIRVLLSRSVRILEKMLLDVKPTR